MTDATDAPIAVAVAFARAEWTSDGTGGLHALARRTAPWASARLESAWAAAPDPPTPAGPAATATIVDAAIVDPRADAVVVQVDVERSWLVGDTAIVDSVPHLLLLTMTDASRSLVRRRRGGRQLRPGTSAGGSMAGRVGCHRGVGRRRQVS